jgi:hypothetical protein
MLGSDQARRCSLRIVLAELVPSRDELRAKDGLAVVGTGRSETVRSRSAAIVTTLVEILR